VLGLAHQEEKGNGASGKTWRTLVVGEGSNEDLRLLTQGGGGGGVAQSSQAERERERERERAPSAAAVAQSRGVRPKGPWAVLYHPFILLCPFFLFFFYF